MATGGRGISVRRLGGDRAGEMRITRFLRNDAVSVAEMVATAAARTAAQVGGLDVLAIQDTTTVRAEAEGRCIALHPVIAVDAVSGTLLGLVGAALFKRESGRRDGRKRTALSHKQSRRWLAGAEQAAALREHGAACVTTIADREGDIYEDFALRPAATEVLVRAGQDRSLADGSRLFGHADALPERARMQVDLPAAPGRPARIATLALRFDTVAIARPTSRKTRAELTALPTTVRLSLVDAREIDPPAGTEPAHWRLLTSHAIASAAQAQRIVGLYRRRWIIEELFRTLKTKGFDVEALRLADGGPLEKLVAASLIAAVTVLQLVRERDGAARRPLADALNDTDKAALEAVCASLEGQTAKQKNPHPKGSLAYAAWTFARLGGWTSYYGKPGPIVILSGLTQFHAIQRGWKLQHL